METNYSGLRANAEAGSHLGGNIVQGDPFTFSPLCWDYLIDRFGVQTIMDVGGGRAFCAQYFHRKGLKVVSVDGCEENVRTAIYPTILHDLTRAALTTTVDMVHCQEVVEHIEEKYLDNLMKTLSSGKVICMTHALPGQGGHHHVNLQPSEYWINVARHYGYSLSVEDTKRVRRLASQEGAQYLAISGLVFVRETD